MTWDPPVRGVKALVYDVRTYGAKGNGTTDDTAAIDSAITAALVTGGTAFAPPGTYEVKGLKFTYTGKRLQLAGAAQAAKLVNTATTSSNTTTTLYVTGGNAIGGDWLEIADLYLEGSATCGMGITLATGSQGRLTNLRIDGFTAAAGWGVGINMGNHSFDWLVTNPVITNCAYAGILIQGAANANVILGGWLYNMPSGSFGVRISTSNGNRIVGTIIQGTANKPSGVELSGSANSIIGCWIEANTVGVYANETGSLIDGCFFSDNLTDIAVEASSRDLVVRNCHFASATPKITLVAGSTNTLIESCTGLTLADITDASGASFAVRNCPGINPVGVVTVAVPASGAAVAAAGYDRTFYVTASTTSVTLAIQNGPTITVPASACVPVFVPAGKTLTPTYTTAPTWVVEGN